KKTKTKNKTANTGRKAIPKKRNDHIKTLILELLGMDSKKFHYFKLLFGGHKVVRDQMAGSIDRMAEWRMPTTVYLVLNSSSTEEWIRKMWYMYTMEYYTAEKNNDIMKLAGKWMELKYVILSE
ncbi:hypothetical protein STEG23_000841, partial [Scotinomys teguina]